MDPKIFVHIFSGGVFVCRRSISYAFHFWVERTIRNALWLRGTEKPKTESYANTERTDTRSDEVAT